MFSEAVIGHEYVGVAEEPGPQVFKQDDSASGQMPV